MFYSPMGVAFSALTDTAIHAPLTSGTYAYNTFKPGTPGFPALGGTFVDPVFNETVRRVTTVTTANDDDIYAHHWCNSNGTMCFSTMGGSLRVYSPQTGVTLYSDQPVGSGGGLPRANLQWHPTDPDKYQRFEGAQVVERALSSQSDATLFTAPEAIDNMGGSLPWVDGSGDYYVVSWKGKGRVWKRSTNTLYSGEIDSFVSNGGWLSITPDARYLVTAAGSTNTPNKEHRSFVIDHVNATVSTSAVQFWGLCGDHGVLVSASNGHNYFVTFACHSVPGLWRADITQNLSNASESAQLAANTRLLDLAWADNDGHLSGNMIGALQDWVFFDTEYMGGDTFDSTPTKWRAFEQEIMAINVVTGEVRRLAHHRSRSLGSNYYYQPHVSSSWDGSVVVWQSNFNTKKPSGYVDTYAISFPAGASNPGGTPKTDTNTVITSITGSNLVGQPYSVAYAVSPGGTGSVTVTDGTGASCASTAPTGSCSLTSTTAGTKTITAAYGGDSTYNASQGTTSYVVNGGAIVPNPPGNVNAIVTSSTVTVNRKTKTVYSGTIIWKDNSENESGFTLQRFTKNAKGCVLETTFKVTVGANVTSYTDQTATANTCGYGVAAHNSTGTSSFVTDYNLAQ